MLRKLQKAYSERHRHYHTHEHIDSCLALLDENKALAEEPDAVETAIWFHDAIYKTRSGTNEEDSAELARAFLVEHSVDNRFVDKIVTLILATKHDAPIEGRDTELLIDIDLAILGAPEPAFREFEENVRKEYSWVPQFLYRRERTKVLRSFLDRESIYTTPAFRNRFEAQARANIELAIDKLR